MNARLSASVCSSITPVGGEDAVAVGAPRELARGQRAVLPRLVHQRRRRLVQPLPSLGLGVKRAWARERAQPRGPLAGRGLVERVARIGAARVLRVRVPHMQPVLVPVVRPARPGGVHH